MVFVSEVNKTAMQPEKRRDEDAVWFSVDLRSWLRRRAQAPKYRSVMFRMNELQFKIRFTKNETETLTIL